MIRELRGDRTAFVLDTPHTTLALLTLPTGQIETVYYGNRIRIDSAEDALALSEKNEFPPGNSIDYNSEPNPYTLEDARQNGKHIQVTFKGALKQNQQEAVDKMLAYDNGILDAATSFGKTVVCCNMIAVRKVNTLILLESASLLDQWVEQLNRFLEIDEELPIYQTKTGRVKTRSSLIGVLQSSKNTTTGIIDIAMAGSVFGKHGLEHKLQEYGMVIIDECHHAASETMQKVLREVKAKYIYGFLQRNDIDEMEMMSGLKHPPIFNPVVADYYCGMESILSLDCTQIHGSMEEIRETYRKAYPDGMVHYEEKLDENGYLPADLYAGRDDCAITVIGNEERMDVIALFDNLGKGASGAAIQNMNIVSGIEEEIGLVK